MVKLIKQLYLFATGSLEQECNVIFCLDFGSSKPMNAGLAFPCSGYITTSPYLYIFLLLLKTKL